MKTTMVDTTGVIDVLPPQMMARRTEPTDPNADLVWLRANSAGIRIDAASAFRWTASWCCIRVITDTIGTLPWKAFRRTPRGREELEDHSLTRLLNTRPNEEMTAFTFREQLLIGALVWGDGFAEIERNGSGAPLAMHPIEPHRVRVRRDGDFGEVYYLVDNERRIEAADMFHLKGLGNGLVGYYVVALFAQAFATGLAAEDHTAQFFGDSAVPSGMLKFPGRLDKEKATQLLADFETRHMKRRRVGLLQNGLEYMAIQSTNEDAQLNETRTFQVLEACRIFRVAPHKIYELSHATFSNIEHQETAVALDTILPWTTKLTQEADAKLIGIRGARNRIFTNINIRGMMRGDHKTRSEFYEKMAHLAVLSPNDILKLEDMNTIGAEGDKRIVPMNMTTLEKIGEDPEPPAMPAPMVNPEEEPEEEPENQPPARNALAMRHVVVDHCERFAKAKVKQVRSAFTRYNEDSSRLLAWIEKYFVDHEKVMHDKLLPVACSLSEFLGFESQADDLAPVVRNWCHTMALQDREEIETTQDPGATLEQWSQTWSFDATNSFLREIGGLA